MRRILVIYTFGIVFTLASCNSEPKVQTDAPPSTAAIQDKAPIKETQAEVIKEPEVAATQSKSSEIEPVIKKPKVKKATNEPEKVKENNSIPAVKRKPTVKTQPVTKAKISFAQTIFEFGEIDEGDTVEHMFEFKNTGSAPLNIEDVSASCGCTVPSYPIMPIEPGGTGKIGVLYNSKGKFGTQKPFLTIKSNATDPLVKLYLSGSIKDVFEKPAVDSSKTSG